jgi:tetratricopeptide (TPR) repeat protein
VTEVSTTNIDRARAASGAPGSSVAARLADGVLVVGFLSLTFLLGVFPLKDTDFWWHLRTGDWIRQTGQVPRHDLYTFTVPDHPWIDLHWGFQVALSQGYERWAIVGLNLAKCVITTAAVLLLITTRRRNWPSWPMLLAWLPALYVLGGRMYIRPETLSLLYISVFLAVLFRWDRWPALAFLLPVVQLFWVNSQGLFVLGIALLAFALIDAVLTAGALRPERRRWWLKVGTASALTLLACLANPYGIRGALFPRELAGTMRNPIFSTIMELKPIPQFIQEAGFGNFQLQMHLLTMALGALSFMLPMCWNVVARSKPVIHDEGQRRDSPVASRKGKGGRKRKQARPEAAASEEPRWRLSPFRVLLYLSFSVLSWQATRNSHQFAAVVGAVTAWNFGEWGAAIAARRAIRAGKRPARAALLGRGLTFTAILLAFVMLASGRLYAIAGEGRTIGLGEEPLWFPHAAVKFAGRPEMPPRFLAFHFGHAALYDYEHGPQRKVFADGRLEVIGPELYERYINLERAISKNEPGWAQQLDAIGRPVVLADNAEFSQVGATLLADPRWKCVWFDPMVSVFVHESNTDAVKSYEVDFGARHFRPDIATAPRGAREYLAGAKAVRNLAASLQALGRSELTRPLLALGLDYARQVRELEPAAPDGWKYIGQLEMSREPGHADQPIPRFRMSFDPVFDLTPVTATYNFRQALERGPNDFLVVMVLARVYLDRGMDEAALTQLEHLVELTPINEVQRDTQRSAAAEIAVLRERLGSPVTTAPPPNRSEHDKLVNALLSAGRAGTAADLLERDYPAEARTWELTDRLATLRLHLGDPAHARGIWQQAASVPRPGLRAARVAATHLVEGSFDLARRAYGEALALEPGLFEAYYGLAVLEQDAGRVSEALLAARQAQAVAPGDVAQAAAQRISSWVAPYVPQTSTPIKSREGKTL